MGRTSMFTLVDRALGGSFERRLRAQRASGATFYAIARWLETDHEIVVSTETVRKWCHELGLEKQEIAS